MVGPVVLADHQHISWDCAGDLSAGMWTSLPQTRNGKSCATGRRTAGHRDKPGERGFKSHQSHSAIMKPINPMVFAPSRA